MLFSTKTQTTLEYGKIIQKLVSCTPTEGAKNRARILMPTSDPVVVKRQLQRTTDAKRLVDIKGYPPFDACEDLPDAIERADKGATLTTKELLHVASLLHSVHLCKDYESDNHLFDSSLDEIFKRLLDNQNLERTITKCILSEDLIADEASPALSDIRRHIRLAHTKIKDTLHSYVSGEKQKALQESLVTMRDGRYVIPVKVEYKGEVSGIIHDTSSTGSTVFIEPMAVVEANNELRTLEIKEQREIERILMELSSQVGLFSSSLNIDYDTITELAFYFGCARLSEEMDATPPTITEDRIITLHHARHPLIPKNQVVPVDVHLGDTYQTLIITGPNTGGKTVTLKTLGLFCAMAQSGLHIPCDEDSVIGIQDAILVDIGDDQSIEESLSTFSSHMVNVANILQNITEHSLVLFDELGAGTDPIEGAALAISILQKAKELGALTCATTHYTELKMYALDEVGVMNASCEFDVNTLKPTYKLIIGAPGKSNAFLISEKLGIPKEILDNAAKLVREDNRNFDHVLEQLEQSRFEMEQAKLETEKMRREYAIFKRENEISLKEKTKEAEKSIIHDRDTARELLDSARISAEFIFKQLEEIKKKQDKKNFAQELEKARKEVREQMKQAEDHYNKKRFQEVSLEEEYVFKRPLVVGDKVYLLNYKQEAEVTKVLNDKEVEVKSGFFRGKVKNSELRFLEDMKEVKEVKQKSQTKVQRGGNANFKMELDVRGRYTDDAWFEVDRYLDEAVLAGVDFVRIVHGKGTGALRVALQKELKNDLRVKSFRLGELGEGDSGVTVIQLK